MQSHFDIKRSLSSADNSSSSSLSSLNASFSSDSSCDNSALNTPPLMQETFYNPINTGTMLFHPSSYALVHEYFNNSDQDFSVPFYQTISPYACAYRNTRSQAMDGYGTLSLRNSPISPEFVSYDRLRSPPIDLQIHSSLSMAQEFAGYVTPPQTYVVPSQTFVESFEGHSLVGLSNALQIKEEYGSPFSEYHTDFSYNQSNNSTPYSSTMSSPTRPSLVRPLRAQRIKFELETSTALQMVQNSTKSNSSRRQAKLQKRTNAITYEKEFRKQFPDTTLKRSGSRKHTCSVPNCNASFERTKHVKRHEATVHNPSKFPCIYCPPGREKYFPKGRRDNYKGHLRRHLNSNKTRTDFNREAQLELDEMASKAGKR